MDDKDEAMELYKVMVTTITASEDRRQKAGTIYMGLLSALFAVLGAVKNVSPIYVAVPSFFIGALWSYTVYYFKELATAKFKVIEDLESQFSFKPFEEEWGHFQKKKITKLSTIEMAIPLAVALFSGTYIGLQILPRIF